MMRSKRTVERWRAVVAAWRRPNELRSVSSWPWTMPAAFSWVSPCLTTSILSLCGGIDGGDEAVIVDFVWTAINEVDRFVEGGWRGSKGGDGDEDEQIEFQVGCSILLLL
jgi:hypothetical protein